MKTFIKTAFCILAFSFLSFSAKGQALYRFGYISYNEVLQAMPEFAAARQAMIEMKAKYDLETKHNEEVFNKMFADFLQGQKDFPLNILLKRQKELQEAMEKNISFRDDAKKILTQAEADLRAPIMAKLDSAITSVGLEHGYEYVINTDDHTFPFIHKGAGEDITPYVKTKLAIVRKE